jgi:phage-related tail fiber protein
MMAVGDDARAANYLLVPNTGEEGRVRWGAREINRTRDYIANVNGRIPGIWPVAQGGTGGNTPATARAGLNLLGKMSMGTGDPPADGQNGDIYFKYTP